MSDLSDAPKPGYRMVRAMEDALAKCRCRTEYGARISLLSRMPYTPGKLPEPIQTQFLKLVGYKTASADSPERQGLFRRGKWGEPDFTVPSTAHYMHWIVLGFSGYCTLPKRISPRSLRVIAERGIKKGDDGPTGYTWAVKCFEGKGMDSASVTMALFTDAQLDIDYVNFVAHRGGGFNTGTLHTLDMFLSLLREKTGWLWQHPELGLLLPSPIRSPAAWRKRCKQTEEALAQYRRDLLDDDLVSMSRDPEDAIDEILALEVPVQAMFDMIDRLADDPPSYAEFKTSASVHKRNILLLEMMAYLPLRIKNYSDMKLGENLYQTPSGAWRLRFPPKAFKNQRGAKKRKYDVPIPKRLWAVIEEYIAEYRPLLFGGDNPKGYVFLKELAPRKPVKDPTRIKQKTFRDIYYRLTARYLGIPFGPHAVRHIVATSILRVWPNNWQKAADALFDTPTTVEKRYTHLAVADGVAQVHDMFNEVRQRAKRNDKGEDE